jgi:phosphoglycerate dehydrogenase-like enzyme
MRIVFHGANAAAFEPGFAEMVGSEHSVAYVSDTVSTRREIDAFGEADVLIGVQLNRAHPAPRKLRLYHAPAAGVDAIDRACLPAGVPLCCCFGHEAAIAEYVMTALLLRHVPIPAADRDLRQGKWTYWASSRDALRTELGDMTLGIVGFGHIGKAVASRAKAFGMTVHVANRSRLTAGPIVDRAFSLAELPAFMGSSDYVLVTLPHNAETEGLIGAAALAAMRPHGVILNVGRGPVIDETALYDALKSRRIGGAVIDTWYVYPSPADPAPYPSRHPFHTLPNCTLTPHMSGWTHGTIRRRQQTIADNIGRLTRGEPLVNVL